MNQPTKNVGEEQYWPNSVYTILYQKNGRKMYCNTVVKQTFQPTRPIK
jgi:hypothetical protein